MAVGDLGVVCIVLRGLYLENSWVRSLRRVLQRWASAAASRTRASLSARSLRSRSTSRCADSLCKKIHNM